MSANQSAFSSLPQRVVVAVIAIPAIIGLAMLGGYAFFAFVLVITMISLYEFYQMVEKNGAQPLKWIGFAAGFLLQCGFIYERLQIDVYQFFADRGLRLAMFSQHQFLLVVLLLFILSTLLLELFRTKGSPTINIATTITGVVCIPLFFGTLINLRELFPYGFPVYKFFTIAVGDEVKLDQINVWGGYTIVALLASIWMCDTAAYFGGVTFGKRRLMERVSPKKSWAGFWFGFFAAIVTMLVARSLVLQYLSVRDAVVIGLFVGVFGQLGDLIQSRFKRDAGVKDSSSLIPGHGGVYDRFDSLVFVSPIVYLYIDFIVLS